MSKNAYDAAQAFPEFITEPRGDVFIKVVQYVSYDIKRRSGFFLTVF